MGRPTNSPSWEGWQASVLFLFEDGLIMHACDDLANRWKGGGVLVLPSEDQVASRRGRGAGGEDDAVRLVSKEAVVEELAERGMRLDLPHDLDRYVLAVNLDAWLDAAAEDDDAAKPPPNLVRYRNFSDRQDAGWWGEYEHREDRAWQEYVLRCWDGDSSSVHSLDDETPPIENDAAEAEEDEDEDEGDEENEDVQYGSKGPACEE